MSDLGIALGAFGGAFMFVVIFGVVIHVVKRSKDRARLINGTSFGFVKSEETRFNGIQKHVALQGHRPSVEQIFQLQDYYSSGELDGGCRGGWEREVIHCTFKTMMLLGYQVQLTRKGRDGTEVPVDLSQVYVRPGKEAKREAKRNKKLDKSAEALDQEEEAKNDFSAIAPKDLLPPP